MGSATRCHFVNPKYDELHGQPCYPSLEALPERPDIAIVALNPLRAASVTEAAAAAGVPGGHHPGRRRGRRRRGGGRDAGRGRPDRPGARPGAPRAELHGRHRPRRQQRDVHRRRLALPATRRRRRDRPVGLGQRRVRPFREPDRLLADHQLRVGGRPRRLRLPRLLPRRPGDELGHPLPRGVQAARAVPRPGRPGARARQADHGRQGRAERPGPGGGGRPFRIARRRDAGDRRRARRGGRHPLPRPRRAARDGRAGRGDPADGPAGSGAGGPAS